MRWIARVLPAAVAVVLSLAAVTGTAAAQPLTPLDKLPDVASGKLGQPNNVAGGTGVSYFNSEFARWMGMADKRRRDAIAACDREAFRRAEELIRNNLLQMSWLFDGTEHTAPRDDVSRGRNWADFNAWWNYYRGLGTFEEACPPPRPPTLIVETEPMPLFIGLPASAPPGGGPDFFSKHFAEQLGALWDLLRRAIDTCDYDVYLGVRGMIETIASLRAAETAPIPGRTEIERWRAAGDLEALYNFFRTGWLRYPRPCEKKQ